ncbi:uncharacterized protein MYCFIDRAFT_171273 [Pseudocercospora fijiensis CIRAD86]|uniref:Uncharacterized protein n=1 Tax=Pseudocercospora fijiensis (strain CIRAD86) TaxID=383855 RepID=M3B7Q0_PSEFD|nr:uncharacterized protein MYCFIDRAFT_171273 [Pseudocercospora fijiensis CIRAD86]EME85337.1 hypothetical protein MYCFIDRAFT_171273 [Pseudocercospora fijiensis CIRAD86]
MDSRNSLWSNAKVTVWPDSKVMESESESEVATSSSNGFQIWQDEHEVVTSMPYNCNWWQGAEKLLDGGSSSPVQDLVVLGRHVDFSKLHQAGQGLAKPDRVDGVLRISSRVDLYRDVQLAGLCCLRSAPELPERVSRLDAVLRAVRGNGLDRVFRECRQAGWRACCGKATLVGAGTKCEERKFLDPLKIALWSTYVPLAVIVLSVISLERCLDVRPGESLRIAHRLWHLCWMWFRSTSRGVSMVRRFEQDPDPSENSASDISKYNQRVRPSRSRPRSVPEDSMFELSSFVNIQEVTFFHGGEVWTGSSWTYQLRERGEIGSESDDISTVGRFKLDPVLRVLSMEGDVLKVLGPALRLITPCTCALPDLEPHSGSCNISTVARSRLDPIVRVQLCCPKSDIRNMASASMEETAIGTALTFICPKYFSGKSHEVSHVPQRSPGLALAGLYPKLKHILSTASKDSSLSTFLIDGPIPEFLGQTAVVFGPKLLQYHSCRSMLIGVRNISNVHRAGLSEQE